MISNLTALNGITCSKRQRIAFCNGRNSHLIVTQFQYRNNVATGAQIADGQRRAPLSGKALLAAIRVLQLNFRLQRGALRLRREL
ncbi:hypothetical protein, partial [Klebsiella aerogenes]|uniref:hypothetical protein n=1 Tax=Klebsiella aerogenes TaxID=548 RepID=UPI001D0D4270